MTSRRWRRIRTTAWRCPPTPLLYLAGLSSAAARCADVLVDGYAYGSLSMTAYTLDARCPELRRDGQGAAPLATGLPPEDANV